MGVASGAVRTAALALGLLVAVACEPPVGNMAPGQTFTFTFSTPGTYTYHCQYHPWMTATITVKA